MNIVRHNHVFIDSYIVIRGNKFKGVFDASGNKKWGASKNSIDVPQTAFRFQHQKGLRGFNVPTHTRLLHFLPQYYFVAALNSVTAKTACKAAVPESDTNLK
jgi:hypothetical protein